MLEVLDEPGDDRKLHPLADAHWGHGQLFGYHRPVDGSKFRAVTDWRPATPTQLKGSASFAGPQKISHDPPWLPANSLNRAALIGFAQAAEGLRTI